MTNKSRICHVLTPSETNTRFICHVHTPSESCLFERLQQVSEWRLLGLFGFGRINRANT